MATHLDLELEKLKNIIIKIENLADSQVSEAIKSLLFEPVSESKELRKTETKIDKLDLKIDSICQNVFALQQPVASDLRFIMSAMQISNEIERIGDLSLSIIKLTKSIKEKHELITKFDVEAIAREVGEITVKTNLCFENLDALLIEEIFNYNTSIKQKSEEAIDNIIAEMKDNSKTVVSGTYLILALKDIQRISDHCTNIAESVYFIINAKTIKHEKSSDKK
ncbi:phosphate signaling complex protein PhoU [Flavobacterium crassostreae]|uniref:Phosphate-specific transport system accessory protein PhoU n=1 Tax=Flavobacterium crassostreae TaxID=1763534 RepID=A0A1B9E6A6_9FLAO|nr:phosphate signaling complex protein PhoU [Flavobacterium crassostreae]OCB77398.1 phosphate transport system regulatory protein PhoU [Flavobacterium crassostreae]